MVPCGPASGQPVTRVDAEQDAKGVMGELTRPAIWGRPPSLGKSETSLWNWGNVAAELERLQ